MQISDIARQYVSTSSSSEAMSGTRGVERLVSTIRDLTAGNIFEGTVNSVKDGKVVLGLSNGTVINARLDASMQLLPGQSMFFQVKSNNGETIAIRPYTVDGNGVNLTLLQALNAAGLPATDKYLTLANQMMHEQMPIDKNTMNQMARILMANPDMSVNTLVQMKKLNIPITSEMIAQFENYVDDSSAVHKELDSFITKLPTTMAKLDMPMEQLKAFDSQLLTIIADGLDGDGTQQVQAQDGSVHQTTVAQNGNAQQMGGAQTVVPEGSVLQMEGTQNGTVQQAVVSQDGAVLQMGASQENVTQQMTAVSGENVLAQNGDASQSVAQSGNTPDANMSQKVLQGEAVQQETVLQDAATQELAAQEKTVQQANTVGSKESMVQLVNTLFGESNMNANDSSAVLLNKLSHLIMTGENISKDTLNQLFSSKDMKQFLRDVLESQMYLTPEEVADGEKVKKLYERLESKTQRLESLLQQAGLQETPLAQTISEVRGNVEFMNQLNQAYTFVQIPLKMAGQNASGQLYVYTNKRDLNDPEKELSAFLHLDLDHLGATDVSVKLLHKKVDTKFYMDSDEAFALVKAHMPELEERLKLKGFDAKIYVENEGKKVDFLGDFLKKDAPPTGQVHRYSFDMRA